MSIVDDIFTSPVLLAATALVAIVALSTITLLIISLTKAMRPPGTTINQLRRPRFCKRCGTPLTWDLFCTRCFRYLTAEALPLSALTLMILPPVRAFPTFPPLSPMQLVLLAFLLIACFVFYAITLILAAAVFFIYLIIRVIAKHVYPLRCPLCNHAAKPDAYFCSKCGFHLFDQQTAADKLKREFIGLISAHTYHFGPYETVALVRSLLPRKLRAHTRPRRPRRRRREAKQQ
jgi:hypothetical protein